VPPCSRTNAGPNQQFVQTEARSVHISRLQNGTTEAELKKLIMDRLEKNFYVSRNPIDKIKLHIHASGRQKGFAIVTLESVEWAQNVIEVLEGASLRSQPLRVRLDKDKVTVLQSESAPPSQFYTAAGPATGVNATERAQVNPAPPSDHSSAALDANSPPRDPISPLVVNGSLSGSRAQAKATAQAATEAAKSSTAKIPGDSQERQAVKESCNSSPPKKRDYTPSKQPQREQKKDKEKDKKDKRK